MISSDVRDLRSTVPKSYPSVFVTSGKQPHGTVSELCSGFEASPIACLDLEDDSTAVWTPTNVWPICGSTTQELIILCSYATCSKLLYINLDDLDSPTADATPSCIAKTPTIWAGSLSDRYFLHVTQDSIRAFEFQPKSRTVHEVDVQIDTTGHTILNATLNRHLGAIAIIAYDGCDYYLEVWIFRDNGNGALTRRKAGDILSIPEEPTCITAHAISDELLIVVGSVAGALLLISWVEHQGSSTLLTHSLDQPEINAYLEQTHEAHLGFHLNTIGLVCENIVVLTIGQNAASQAPTLHVLCGLRNGTLCSFPILEWDGTTRLSCE